MPQIWFFPQLSSSATHHPRFVTEVVYRMQSVDAGHACILQANNNATMVSTTSHAVGMLADQDKVRFQAPGRKGVNRKERQDKESNAFVHKTYFLIYSFHFRCLNQTLLLNMFTFLWSSTATERAIEPLWG